VILLILKKQISRGLKKFQVNKFYYSPEKKVSDYIPHSEKLPSLINVHYEGESVGSLFLHSDFERPSVKVSYWSINEKFRGLGLGQELMKSLIKEARKNSVVAIFTRSDNSAVEKYEKAGFVKADFDDGLGGEIMVYSLLELTKKQVKDYYLGLNIIKKLNKKGKLIIK